MKADNRKHFPYVLGREEKDRILTEKLTELCRFHAKLCPEYGRMLEALGTDPDMITDYRQIPPLPVGLFKQMRLSSIDAACNDRSEDISGNYKVLTSSGTSGQAVSQIVLDGETRTAQQRALAEIGTDFLGEKRLPMLVIDCESTVKNREMFSARTAGIQGFSLFGAHRTFALNDDMRLDTDRVREFLDSYGAEPFLMFGFTYIIWESLLQTEDAELDLSNGILIHGGGWKKLADLNISEEMFRERLKSTFGLMRVHDYYGMAEQAGSIFMECEEGHMHCSDYSAVVIRRPDMSECDPGEKGIIEVMSTLPKSYPGHVLLTEDEGILLGEDDCPCGRKGAYFRVTGRIPRAEVRGCSDTYEKI